MERESMMTREEIRERVAQFAREITEKEGFEPVDVEYKGSILRVTIEGERGISLDDCAKVSRGLSEKLDLEDFIPHRYTLEVSSPGLDRSLKKPKDFLKFQGREVRIETKTPIEGQYVHLGLLGLYKNGIVPLQQKNGKLIEIPWEEIRKANLEVEW